MKLLLLLFALAGQDSAASVSAQSPRDEALEAATRAVAAELRCVVCQGLSIQDSPSELAQSMRAVVRDQLAEGRTPEEVKAYFVSRYGEWVLLRPEPRGFNLAVYLLPVAALLGGALFLVVVIRRWARQPATTDSALQDEPDLAPWDAR